MHTIATVLYWVLTVYIFLVFVWALSSWFPNMQGNAFMRTVEDLVAPYMNLFKGLKLGTGGMDFTPLIAIIVLYIVRALVVGAAGGGMGSIWF